MSGFSSWGLSIWGRRCRNFWMLLMLDILAVIDRLDVE